MSETLLQLSGISKCYGQVTVLDRADLCVQAGQVHALLGANGAGKSTLSRIIAGLVPGWTGTMSVQGEDYSPSSKRDAEQAGIEIVQQEFSLVPTLSVAENLFLNNLPTICGVIRRGLLLERARELLERFQMEQIDPTAQVGSLGVGQQQMLEIAAAFGRHCKLLILDEPTAALSSRETELLFAQIAKLKALGTSFIYISHRLEEVQRICDCVTILRDGKVVRTAKITEVSTPDIIREMSGQEASASKPTLSVPPSESSQKTVKHEVALKVDRLCCRSVKDVTFEVHRGERFGVAGLVGSGRTRLLRAIFGADQAESGNIFIGISERTDRFTHPSQAVANGIAMITEDRKQTGLLLNQSIEMNIGLASLHERFSRFGLLRSRKLTESARTVCEKMERKFNSLSQSVETLSGGNQQKVVLAKWLTREATIFLFDEPTRGIDVAARKMVHDLLAELASAGKSMVIVSSELDELFETCDRIGVMSRGRLVRIFRRDEWSRHAILEASLS